VFSQGQNTACHLLLEGFRLDHDPDMRLFMDSYDWSINGTHIDRKKDKVDFVSHHPGFDTIYFSNNEGQDTVITRFRPGKNYHFTIGAGMAGFDVHEIKTGKQVAGPKKTSATLDLKIENLAPGDTLAGFFIDFYGSEAIGTLITKNGLVQLGQPVKFTSEDQLSYIIIGTLVRPLVPGKGQKKIVYPKIQVFSRENVFPIVSVHTRFMYGEKLQGAYDATTKKLKLEVK
jgi:hypothetical protein